MEEENDNFDIYYQINSLDDIQEDKLNDIKKNPYFLIESKKNYNKINIENIKNLLIDDGVDINQISEFRYLIKEEKNDKIKILLKPLSDSILNNLIANINEIYLHLIIEESETPKEDLIIEEMDEFNTKILKTEKDFEGIKNDIRNDELYNKKILSDTLYTNIEKNYFSKNNYIEQKESKTEVKGMNISNFSLPEITDEIIEEDNDMDPDDNISRHNSVNVNDYNNNQLNFKYPFKKLNTAIIPNNFEKKGISLCYLYSNPLLQKDNKKIYEDNDCFNEIISIYNILKDSNLQVELKFEPIIYNFITYLEFAPDILHIKINSINDNNKIKIILDYLGEIQYYKCEDLKTSFGTEAKMSQIKLLIISTQNIPEIKPYFNNIGIKNIIYINNIIKYPEPNESEENFVKEFYKNILIDNISIQDALKRNKGKFKQSDIVELYSSSKKNVDYILPPKKNKNNLMKKNLSQKQLPSINKINNKIILNKNCSLNLDFIKYNYKRVIGRNTELKNCIDKMNRYNNVFICGIPGSGKKSFVQLVGKFAFERKMYKEVHYIEIYYLRNAEQILVEKIKKIKSNMNLEENQSETDMKKILLIINFDDPINDEDYVKYFEILISKVKDKYINYLFAFSIYKNLLFPNIKKKLYNIPLIELKKLDMDYRIDLYNLINYDLKKQNKKLFKSKEKELMNKTNGYPNGIYLMTLYINCFYEKINNTNIDELSVGNIFKSLIEKYEKKMKKILSIFAILKLGIRDDILDLFFDKEEINFIINDLKYIIFVEKDDHGKNYMLDSSFKMIIRKIMEEKYQNEYINYLYLILKNYAIIFRYLVNYSQYPYDICFEFHAGINKAFWFSVNEIMYKEKFLREYEKFKKLGRKIYFDDVKYFNNILTIVTDDSYIDNIKKRLNEFKEYISQISICLPTILYFENSNIYTCNIENIFNERTGYLNLNKSRLRLKMFKYWISGESNFLPNDLDLKNTIEKEETDEIKKLNRELKTEYYLLKIYDYIKKKEKYDISNLFEKCQNYIDNNFSRCKLNLLYVKSLPKKIESYFDNAIKFAEYDGNSYMKIMALIMKAEYLLSKSEFDKFNELITECENEKSKGELSIKNSNINYIIDKAVNDKNNKYKEVIKNKLFFFTSNPFFDQNNKPLETESNNSFYLKYNLITQLPKNLTIEFQNIDENFLSQLEKCLYNPMRFMYIGSDAYSDKNELFYTKDFISYPFQNQQIKKILSKAKNKCDIVILGFLNSEKISQYFNSNKFPHIISIKKIDELNKLFQDYPYYYFYFQRCFYIFITDFLLNLSKNYCPIKEAFIKANNTFNNNFIKLMDYNEEEEEKERINNIKSKGILILIGDEKRDEEVFFNDFEDLNNQSFSNSSSSLLNMVSSESSASLESNFSNNSYFKKNSIWVEEKKEISKPREKKMEFFQFPYDKKNSNNESFKNLYENRLFGMKQELKNLIKKISNYKFINIYGDSQSGKTRLCFELCKYFYMNNKFKEGIFYINLNRINKIKSIPELKELSKKNSKNKISEPLDALLIFDDVDKINKNCYSYIAKINAYALIVTKNIQKDSWENYNKNYKNKINGNSINDYEDILKYENLNKPLDKNFAKEFCKYLQIIKNITNDKFKNVLLNEKVYIKDIIERLKIEIEENKRKKKKELYSLTSSQIKYG